MCLLRHVQSLVFQFIQSKRNFSYKFDNHTDHHNPSQINPKCWKPILQPYQKSPNHFQFKIYHTNRRSCCPEQFEHQWYTPKTAAATQIWDSDDGNSLNIAYQQFSSSQIATPCHLTFLLEWTSKAPPPRITSSPKQINHHWFMWIGSWETERER